MLTRSSFDLVCVQQFVVLAQQESWALTPRLRDFARKSSSRLVQTQVSEDGFNRARTEEDKGRTKKMSDERAWGCLIEAEVLSNVHRFTDIPWKRQQVPPATRLSASIYHSKLRECSLPEAESLAGYAQQTKWFSPSPANMPQPTCDLDIAAALNKGDSWSQAENLWQSCLFAGDALAVRHVSWPADKWCLSLGRIGSMSLGWPLLLHSFASPPLLRCASTTYMVLDPAGAAPGQLQPLVCVDEADWTAQPLSLLGPLEQRIVYPQFNWKKASNAGIRLVPDGPAESLLKVQARHCFPGATTALIARLCRHRGLATASTDCLFNLLWSLAPCDSRLHRG